jgi:hypothetical protein
MIASWGHSSGMLVLDLFHHYYFQALLNCLKSCGSTFMDFLDEILWMHITDACLFVIAKIQKRTTISSPPAQLYLLQPPT